MLFFGCVTYNIVAGIICISIFTFTADNNNKRNLVVVVTIIIKFFKIKQWKNATMCTM